MNLKAWPPDRSDRRSINLDGIDWDPGKKFRVVVEGCQLSGWQPFEQGAFSGWSRRLQVGEVIECAGYGAGFGSDPGFGVEFHDPEVGLAEFHPTIGGILNYRPEPGCLEPDE